MKRTRSRGLLGRPRAFDIEKTLERALQVFWEKGYEGSSLSDLTEAMGINRPSLYAAFGNKEALFRKALDRYVEKTRAFVRDAINEPTARGVAERLLRSPADMARYLATVYQGMSVQAAGGATREQLRRVAETALRAWPSKNQHRSIKI